MYKSHCYVNALFLIVSFQLLNAQTLPTPNILEVYEDDRVATIYWNSKTNTYHPEYDPDKQQGIYSYLVEWGTLQDGFTESAVTPYRVHMIQPLDPNEVYIARVSNLDKIGNKSNVSSTVQFQHDPSRVNALRNEMNGFFDDMNTPMGAFSEKDWNQSYSGCMTIGAVSQHINNQYHGHNVIRSGHCDRGAASSRLRHPFDFTDRTGTIVFDLDGGHKTRQLWYLDVTPFERKRDLTGHILSNPGDPASLLRIQKGSHDVSILMVDQNGEMTKLANVYDNNACGDLVEYCSDENLQSKINVRKRWRIELSKTHIKIFINEILVVDGSLITSDYPNGLPYEKAQLNWVLFSYNTPKDNIVTSMIHWDNFGIDAPTGYAQTEVIHNYTDGILGTETPRIGNEASIGMTSSYSDPGISQISIPDQINDDNGNPPLKAELMFTLQSGHYSWNANDHLLINGNNYDFPKPASDIPNFPDNRLVGTNTPYSAIIDLDPADLITGNNQIEFYFDDPRLLNIHIELTYPINDAPTYTSPSEIYTDHLSKLMNFWNLSNTVGPGIRFNSIDGFQFWDYDFNIAYDPTPDIEKWFVKQTPVQDSIELEIQCNSVAQLAATGKAAGISYFEILMDEVPIMSIPVDNESPVAFFETTLKMDTKQFTNGEHQLYIQAFDVNGKPSLFDSFSSNADPGQYMPTIINIQNSLTNDYDLDLSNHSITLHPNPNEGYFKIVGSLSGYDIDILDSNGVVVTNLNSNDSAISIDINSLPSGLYFVRVKDKNLSHLSIEKILKL